jgi:hypothetical protein
MKVLRFAAAFALLAPCAALANVTEDIRADGGTIIPQLGVSIDVAGTSGPQNHTSLSHAIDMGFAYAKSRHKQELEARDGPVIFGGEMFSGQQQDITWTSNIQLVHIGYRPRYWFGNSNFAIDGLIGLGWAGLGLKGTSTTGQAAAERLSNGGVVFGLGGLWRFAPATTLQVRLLAFGSGKDEGVTSAARWDLTVTHAIAKNLQLRGGLGVLSAYSAREDADSAILKSPVNAGGAGLTLGVDFLF